MTQSDDDLIDWSVFTETRAALGQNFIRILGYFREDGAKSIAQIEAALRTNDATQIVMPAHMLKGEAGQFGATRLCAVAEQIEHIARKCIEHHDNPNEIIELVVKLRPMFEETLSLLDKESSPVVKQYGGGFGRNYIG